VVVTSAADATGATADARTVATVDGDPAAAIVTAAVASATTTTGAAAGSGTTATAAVAIDVGTAAALATVPRRALAVHTVGSGWRPMVRPRQITLGMEAGTMLREVADLGRDQTRGAVVDEVLRHAPDHVRLCLDRLLESNGAVKRGVAGRTSARAHYLVHVVLAQPARAQEALGVY
jgi:hypothetical protein